MILLHNSTSNSVYLTLSEKTTISNPEYLFVLTDFGNNITSFYSDDLAPASATSRYNQFTVILSGASSVNLSAGTINLGSNTQYKYQVYEKADKTDFSYSSATKLETGRLFISGTTKEDTITQYTETDSEGTVIYTG